MRHRNPEFPENRERWSELESHGYELVRFESGSYGNGRSEILANTTYTGPYQDCFELSAERAAAWASGYPHNDWKAERDILECIARQLGLKWYARYPLDPFTRLPAA